MGAGDVVCFQFYKGFDTVPCSILIYQPLKYELGGWEIGLTGLELVERPVLNGTKFIRHLMANDTPQGLMLMSVLFNIYGGDLGNETECGSSKLANYQTGTASDEMQFGETSTGWRNGVIMMNLMKFDKRKCQVI